MSAPRRTTSAETAARFLARRRGRRPNALGRAPRPVPSPESIEAEHTLRWMARVDELARNPPRDRIVIDFNRATARVVYDVLCDRLGDATLVGKSLDLTVIAVEMIGAALGLPPTDDPPLTDRRHA